MFKIRDEYGQLVEGSVSNQYDMTCRIAHYLREYGVDFFVVEDGRAVSEVVKNDEYLDFVASIVAETLWKKHKELV